MRVSTHASPWGSEQHNWPASHEGLSVPRLSCSALRKGMLGTTGWSWGPGSVGAGRARGVTHVYAMQAQLALLPAGGARRAYCER